MKSDGKAAWRPKRFDVAGAHPDEAWRVVAGLVNAVDEIGKQWAEVEGFPRDLRLEATKWRQTRPMRYGANLDADVQQFMARGVQIMDRLNKELPVGLSHSQNKVRDRCDELARSMKKVLDSRPDEFVRGDPWRGVKIQTSPVLVKERGQKALSERETREAVRNCLRRHFTRGPWEAMRAKAAYLAWEQNAERRGVDAALTEAAKPWKHFSDELERGKWLSASKNEVWAHVDVNEGIDFSQVQKAQQVFRRRRGMRM